MSIWKRFTEEKPDYGMNVLVQTTDGWMHEAFRNIGNRGDFYRSGKYTIDESQLFSWRFLPEDIHGGTPINAPNHEETTRCKLDIAREALENMKSPVKVNTRDDAWQIAREALEAIDAIKKEQQ